MARNGFFISDELCIKTCGSNRKDTYELFRKYVPGFNMSYEKYYEGRNQVNIDYPSDLLQHQPAGQAAQAGRM